MKKCILLSMTILMAITTTAQDKTISFTNKAVFTQSGSGSITQFIALLPIPQTNEYQTISNLSVNEGETVEDKNYGNTMLYFSDDKLPQNPFELSSTFDVTPKVIDIDLSKITDFKDYDPDSEPCKRHLGNRGAYIDTSNSYIVETGDKLWAESENVLDYARRCYEYVASNFDYIHGSWRTLSEILELKGGECGDLSTVVINLLRYKGIPSRHNICIRHDEVGYHVWVDFYLEDYGWIPLDATYKHNNPSGDYFGKYDGNCIVLAQDIQYDLSDKIIDTLFMNQVCAYWYWYSGSSCSLALDHVMQNNGATGIASFRKPQYDDSCIYNLKGQKVNADYKGIVILNGKKVIVKHN